MFRTVKRWIFWYQRSRHAKKVLKAQILMCKKMGPAVPPTPEEVEKFKKDFGNNEVFNTHMVQRVEQRKTYFELNLN